MLDLSVFDDAMAYVALSRVKQLQHLHLIALQPEHMVSELVRTFGN